MGQTTFSGPVVSQNGFIENSFTTAQRDAIVNPTAGLLIYNTTTNTYQVYNGSTWQTAFAPPVPAPEVYGLTTESGSTAGGTSTVIIGANFTGATSVKFGGVEAASFTVLNSNQIQATTAAHAAGAVSVDVTTPGGTNAPNTLFTYSNIVSYDAGVDYFSPGLMFNGLISNYIDLDQAAWNNTRYTALQAQTAGQVYTLTVGGGVGAVTFTTTGSWMPFGAGLYRVFGTVSAGGGSGTNLITKLTYVG